MNGWMAQIESNRWFQDQLRGLVNIFSYEARGSGKSPKHGRLDPVQNAIDAEILISQAFEEYDRLAESHGKTPGNKSLQGNCLGTMGLAALFAGRFPLSRKVDSVILISPVSKFDLPWKIKFSFFVPPAFGGFLRRFVAPTIIRKIAAKEESEKSRQEALRRLYQMDLNAASRQAREIFWKANVSGFWKYINVPALILVSRDDPMVKIEQSAEVFHELPYPIWMELRAPDHLILEDNIDLIREELPKYLNDPWGYYEKHKNNYPDL